MKILNGFLLINISIYDDGMQIWRSSNVKRSEDATVLTVTQDLHCHLDCMCIEDGLNAFTEESILFCIVAELIEVFQLNTFHEVTAGSIVREEPNLGKLVSFGDAVIEAHEIEAIDWH